MNEDLFHLTNDILLLKENDRDSHCPLVVKIDPSDLSNQREEVLSDSGIQDEQK